MDDLTDLDARVLMDMGMLSLAEDVFAVKSCREPAHKRRAVRCGVCSTDHFLPACPYCGAGAAHQGAL